ncbi:MAG TPA: S41 family peptidase [Caldilineaceae bacterium]|mgnify:CR=1 FL=1|nr:S41 family peptidase [Caldilineaceae bacterium]
MMRRFLKWTAILVGLVVLTGAAFSTGFVMADSNPLTPCIVRTSDQPAPFNTFWQAWNLVQKDFVDRSALDPTTLTYGAIRGMVNALGDKGHSAFLTPQEKNQRASAVSGSFTGIGAEMGIRNGLPVVVAPIDGGPAIKAGIKAGDILLRVDGADVTSLDLSDIVQKVRGPAGTPVNLTVLRPADNKTYDFTIVRENIDVPAATWTMIPGTDVALIRFSQFSQNAQRDVTAAIEGAQAAGAKGLIVDVRNNPGGLLDQAVSVTSQFLKDGNVLLEADAQNNRTAFPVQPGGQATSIPMVVLVNPGTASAAEIFAGAIQDHQRGQVVGETTFGTGTVLEPFELNDGSELLLGVKQWLTPNGRLIRNQGIQPNVEVKVPLGTDLLSPDEIKTMKLDQIKASADTQLVKALELLGQS